MSAEPKNGEDAHARERELAELVLGYLGEHPQAMETLEGIAEWWIERRSIRVEIETLSRVLETLIERGAIEVVGSGANRRYRVKGSTA